VVDVLRAGMLSKPGGIKSFNTLKFIDAKGVPPDCYGGSKTVLSRTGHPLVYIWEERGVK